MKPAMDEQEHERAVESLSDGLATWWEAFSGEETHAHQWTSAAEAALRAGPTDN